MIRRYRLIAVLRARQVQEDVAKGSLARARREALAAKDHVTHQASLLRAHVLPHDGTGHAIVAALAARQSLGAALGNAVSATERAEQHTVQRIGELTEAAIRRRGMEKLVERHALARRAKELSAEQRGNDELAVTERLRAAAREVTP